MELRAIGPVAGGWIAQKLPDNGYVWVFYSTTILCALVQLAGLLWLKETYYPVLLSRRAGLLKAELGLDPRSDKVQTVYQIKEGPMSVRTHVSHGLKRPFVMLWNEPIIQVLAAYVS